MKTLIVVLLCVTTAGIAQTTDHAPTLEQCTADINLWHARLGGGNNWDSIKAGTQDLTVETMETRKREIGVCALAYPKLAVAGPGEDSYIKVISDTYDEVISRRLEAFLTRHRLYDKFLEEDRQGLR